MTADPLVDDSGRARRARRIRRTLLVVGLLVVLATGLAGGWKLAHQFESPQQRVANAKPPVPSALWYPVTRGRLTDQASGRGTIKPVTTTSLAPRELPANAVVTGQRVAPGDEIGEMTAFTEVNGEPVFATSGAFPYYRDLGPKMTGPDVEQLQHSLLMAGYYIPVAEFGTYGKETKGAVHAAYVNHGYADLHGVPLTSLAVVPTLPSRVVSASPVGKELELGEAVATLGSGESVAQAQMAAGAASRMRPGMHAQIFAGGKLLANGTVRKVLKTEDGTQVQVSPSRTITQGASKRNVVVIVEIKAVARRALLVPARSVRSDDGKTGAVVIRHANGDTDRVEVRTLGELAGVAAIAPTDPAHPIAVSDQVKVG